MTRRFGPTAVASLLGVGLIFYLANRISEHVRTHLATGQPAATMLDDLVSAIGADWMRVSLERVDLIAGVIAAVVGVLVVVYHVTGKKNMRPGEEQG